MQEERAAKALAELQRRYRNNDALRRQMKRAAAHAKVTDAVNYLPGEEVHTLWSDGSGNDIFGNTHECWDYVATVR